MSEAVAHDPNGRPALVESDGDAGVSFRLSTGARVVLPQSLVERQPDGSYLVSVVFDDLALSHEVLQEIDEQITVQTVERERSRVVARTVTDVREEPVDADDGWRETVEVERVAVDRVVDRVEDIRTDGDVTIIPVYEEVLVVQKQLVLREEVRLTTRREPVSGPATVALRHQRVEVDRHPAPAPGTRES